MKDDRIWERLYTIPQKAFSFHASQPVLLLRGLILFALGLFGVFNPAFVLSAVTMVVGGVLLLFAVASFLMAGRGGRISTSLLLLFLVMGALGVGLLVRPLFFDRILMVVLRARIHRRRDAIGAACAARHHRPIGRRRRGGCGNR